jgi:hypothetical protein
METKIVYPRPSYVMNADGQPEAVLIDFSTWQTILEWLEEVVDHQILHQARADLALLTQGNRPPGWQNWDDFDTELEALELAGELSD